MSKSIKRKIAKATACNRALNKTVITLNRSFKEVYAILNCPNKKNKKKNKC